MKKTFFKICTIFFVLASLLPMNWSVDAQQATANVSLPVTIQYPERVKRGNRAPHIQPVQVPQWWSLSPFNFVQYNSYSDRISGLPIRVSWEVDIDFPDQGIRAVWIFRIEQEVEDHWVLTDEYIQNITEECDTDGNPEFGDGWVTLSDGAYIQCQTPDFKEIAEEMNTELSLDNTVLSLEQNALYPSPWNQGICTQCLEPWINGAVKVDKSAHNQNMPLVTIISDDQQVPLLDGTEGKTVFEVSLRQIPGSQSSRIRGSKLSQIRESTQANLVTDLTDWNSTEQIPISNLTEKWQFWTGKNVKKYQETLVSRHSNFSTPWIDYWSLVDSLNDVDSPDDQWLSWTSSSSGGSSTEAQPYTMSNRSHTIYIGHKPDTEDYFHGTIYNIGVDPPCIGFGG